MQITAHPRRTHQDHHQWKGITIDEGKLLQESAAKVQYRKTAAEAVAAINDEKMMAEGEIWERGCSEMLIIGFGVTEVLLSTLVFTCETCGNHAAHQLTKQNRKFSPFFIPLFSVGTKYLDSCTACGRIIEVSNEQAEAAARQVGPDLR